MGDKGSSSKRKSSKKKRNKISSQVLKKKSRRKESKRHVNSNRTSSSDAESDYRNRKVKSKKRHRAYSVSSSSDDRSVLPASVSLSTSDGYKRGKSKHESLVASKSRKKRSMKRYGSPADDVGSRKRKRSTRDSIVKSRKKSLKKSRKRFTSSSSSDSENCPSCYGRSCSSTSDGKHQRSKATLDKEIARTRGRGLHKDHTKRKVRSPSSSSCSGCADHVISVDHSDKALAAVNNSRRLKSVISIANQNYDENKNRCEMDSHKEEMVYDNDDYPSPKSLDSNEGGSMKEPESHFHSEHNKTIHVQNVEGQEVTEPMKYGNDGYDRYCAGDSLSDEVPSNNSEIEKETHASVTVAFLDEGKNKDRVGDGDLEPILRRKALENLRRFRGGFQAGQKTISDLVTKNENVNESSTQKADSIQIKSTKHDRSGSREMEQASKPTMEKKFSQLTWAEKDSGGEHAVQDYGISKRADAHPPNDAAFIDYKEKEKLASSPAIFAKLVSSGDINHGAGLANSSMSTTEQIPSIQPMSEEPSLNVQQNDASDGSEFQQKTMSVMRGGEMVQVSYKVYIPKRAPALARRQLRR